MLYTNEDVSSAREVLGALWPLLRPGLWHSTAAGRYHSILKDGEIRPDGGQGGNVYKGSYAVHMEAVSLFDFESASEDEALGTYKKWCDFLWRRDNGPLTVWIGLKRDLLPGRLMLPTEIREGAVRASKNWYPRVEACHLGPVPADAFDRVLAVSTTTPLTFELLAIGEAALPRLDELAEEWRKPPDEEDLIVERLRAARTRSE
jgi:hypothetical protein